MTGSMLQFWANVVYLAVFACGWNRDVIVSNISALPCEQATAQSTVQSAPS
jgi:hypothetical protein